MSIAADLILARAVGAETNGSVIDGNAELFLNIFQLLA